MRIYAGVVDKFEYVAHPNDKRFRRAAQRGVVRHDRETAAALHPSTIRHPEEGDRHAAVGTRPRRAVLIVAAVAAAAACLAVSPYLAGLTVTVPNRHDGRWFRPTWASGRRVVAVAAVAGLVGGLAGLGADWSALLPAHLALAIFGTPLAVIDAEHRRLPNRLVYPAGIAAASLLAADATAEHSWGPYLRAVLTALAAASVFVALALATPTALGGGDARLAVLLGGYLGYVGWRLVYVGLFAGFALAAVLAVTLLVAGRVTRKTALPLGPMLIVGALGVLAFHRAGVLGS